MRWPYVSREFLASAEARARAEHENAQSLRHALVREELRCDHERAERLTERDAAERRYQDLLAKFLVLRLRGALDQVAATVPQAVEKEPQSEGDKEISKVIREQAGDNHALARELRATARELKRAGKNPDEIVGALVQYWSSESVGQG